MRIHIVNKGEDHIQGYEKVEVSNGAIDLSSYSNNECDYILAGDLLDMVDINSHGDVVALLLSRLRLNGTLVIGGTDLRLFCQHASNGTISEDEACAIISSKKSFSTFDKTRAIVESLGLKVRTLQTNGVHYEYTATRQ